MKLIVVIVVSIVVLTVSSREPPDGRKFYNDEHSFSGDLDIPEEHDLSNGRELTSELANSYGPEHLHQVLTDVEDVGLKDVKVGEIQKEQKRRGGSKCKKLEGKVDDLETKLNRKLDSIMNYIISSNSNLTMANAKMKDELDSIIEHQGCSKGTFLFSPTNQCFRLLNDKFRNYDDGKAACRSLGLQLGQSIDPISLREYLISKYGQVSHIWVGARGTGTYITWERTGVHIKGSDRIPYWANGRPGSDVSSANCLILLGYGGWWKSQPNQPYYNHVCSNTHWVLCELVRG